MEAIQQIVSKQWVDFSQRRVAAASGSGGVSDSLMWRRMKALSNRPTTANGYCIEEEEDVDDNEYDDGECYGGCYATSKDDGILIEKSKSGGGAISKLNNIVPLFNNSVSTLALTGGSRRKQRKDELQMNPNFTRNAVEGTGDRVDELFSNFSLDDQWPSTNASASSGDGGSSSNKLGSAADGKKTMFDMTGRGITQPFQRVFKASRSVIRDRFPSASSLHSSVSSSSLSSGHSASMSPTSCTTAPSVASKGFASKSNSFSSFLPSLNTSAATSNRQQQYHLTAATPSELSLQRNSFSNLQFMSELYRNDFDSDDEAKLTKKQARLLEVRNKLNTVGARKKKVETQNLLKFDELNGFD